MRTVIHIPLRAEAVVNPYRFVRIGATDNSCVQAAAVADVIVGVSNQLTYASGDIVDVIPHSEGEVQLGGAVTRGQRLTTNATGQAVAAAVAGDAIGGIAMASGVAGDVISIIVTPGAKF